MSARLFELTGVKVDVEDSNDEPDVSFSRFTPSDSFRPPAALIPPFSIGLNHQRLSLALHQA